MIDLPDTVVNLIYFITVPILAIIGTYCYMNSHSIISTGPEGEAKGCFSVFLSFLIGAGILVTIIMAVFAWIIGFIVAHWIWFAVGAAVIVALVIAGSRVPDKEKGPDKSDDSNNHNG
ncbi:hypothetical protein [Pectinatus frisingensis]|jgi:hypothetical protein|uniref:hypothetical protein n=1 Tax=Pectinatus frisingensis TaxID=865 RepID=UPI0018C7102A|nr:hypothetical protein [Pectinatus frisingensis]